MKKIIIALISILFTFIGVTFLVSAFILNGGKILSSFNIIDVENVSTNFSIKFEKVKAAEYYDIVVYNSDNIPIYSKTIYENENQIDLNMLEYNLKYKLIVYAYDKLGDSIAVKNPYKFKYTEPTFSSNNDLILNNAENYKILIDGDLSKKNYKIAIYDNKYKLKEEKLISNEYIIDKKFYQDMNQKLDVQIFDGLTSISKISLYNKTSPVSDIVITSPASGNILDYNDVVFTYDGGDNATSYIVEIYNEDQKIKETTVKKNRCVISAGLFEKAEKYNIIIKALYKDYEEYTKSDKVEFQMNEKETLKPVYINSYHKYVKAGSYLYLNNPNQEGTIFYTIDGSDPIVNGKKYEKPLLIKKNMTLKTVIMEPKMNNSIVNEFEINIGVKDTYSVYLSPSNQEMNFGIKSTGYSNEQFEMNDLTNFIEKRLKSHNIKVYRNSPYGNINLWTADSRYYGVDLHLAIHSNASPSHDVFGIETWIHEQSSKTYSLANLIQDSLINIYYSEEEIGNRGVKYANGAMGEVNELAVPFGILIEIAHHDYEKDAAWIIQNKELIGNTIADTILKYYGLI
ncbi:MAG: FN3 associated domain-containing protein [Bacilli bacterium]|nr:FN3 associated domain-containing protein [Bacilli bacterium]